MTSLRVAVVETPDALRTDRRREALFLALLVAIVVSVALGVSGSRLGSGALVNSDAKYTRLVATQPFGKGTAFAGQPSDVGVATRYGRILFPLLSWAAAGGQAKLLTWSMALVYVLALALMTWSACDLCARWDRPPLQGLIVLFVPALWLTMPILFLEPLVLAFVLLTYQQYGAGNMRAARLSAAFACLTREIAVIVIIPFIVMGIRRRAYREAAAWVVAALPLAVWWGWVRLRIGEWPGTEPGQGVGRTITWPFGGWLSIIRDGSPFPGWLVLAIILGTVSVVGAAIAFRRAPESPIAQSALLFALLICCFGPTTVRLPNHAVRLMLPAQALVVLSFLSPPHSISILGDRRR